MDKPKSALGYWLSLQFFKLRHRVSAPERVLAEADVKPGHIVLDYGCGAGGFALAAAEIVGPQGRVFAVDIQPQALYRLLKLTEKRDIRNLEPIITSCSTGLHDKSVDLVLLYDTYHGFSEPECNMGELHRVLRPGGLLSFSDHHMKEKDILDALTGQGLFAFVKKNPRTYTFAKA